MTLIFGLIILPSGKAHAAISASLTIADESVSGTAEPSGIAYAKSNVTYSASDISKWSLRVSYASGKTALAYDGTGGTTMSGTSTTTGVAPASMANNTWGYAWSDSTSPTQSSLSYKTMPAYDSPAEMKTGTTNVSTTGSINFAAKFASNAVSGHYKTEVLVSLVATPPSVTYTLTYNSNTTDTVSGMPANQTCTATSGESCTITISSNTPTRTDYDFQGWSTSSGTSNTVTNAKGSSITMTGDKPLYAVWQAQGPAVSGFGGITQMQQMNSSICSGASANATGQLYDTRDNSTYTIKKIGSKCWMTQNLRLSRESINAKDSTNTTGRITTSDSNTSGNYDIPASVAVTSDTTTGSDTASVFSNNNATQQVRKSTNATYGAYYSWCAATANTCSSATTDGAEVSYDICPKGWQLPSGKPGTGTNDFAVAAGLASTNITVNGNFWSSLSSPSFASNALTVNGITWAAAGLVNTSGLSYVGTHARYWSRTARSDTIAYYLNFSFEYFFPSHYSNERYYGMSVQCVAK